MSRLQPGTWPALGAPTAPARSAAGLSKVRERATVFNQYRRGNPPSPARGTSPGLTAAHIRPLLARIMVGVESEQQVQHPARQPHRALHAGRAQRTCIERSRPLRTPRKPSKGWSSFRSGRQVSGLSPRTSKGPIIVDRPARASAIATKAATCSSPDRSPTAAGFSRPPPAPACGSRRCPTGRPRPCAGRERGSGPPGSGRPGPAGRR